MPEAPEGTRYVVGMSEMEAVCAISYMGTALEQEEEAVKSYDAETAEVTRGDIERVRAVYHRLNAVFEEQESERAQRYWNVASVLDQWQHHRSYSDFEGFANPGRPARLVRDALSNDSTDQSVLASTTYTDDSTELDATDLNRFIRDMLLHYCYETVDQAGAEFLPSPQELTTAAHVLSYVFNGSARFMKVSEADYASALETPEEDE